MRQAYEARGEEIRELPDDVLAAVDEAGARIWQAQAQKGDKAAEQISKMGAFRKELGHLGE